MRLGTETGSLINHIYSNTNNGTKPAVGMGVTLLSWTDRNPGTIQAIRELASKKWLYEVEVTEDDAKRIDSNGMSESQEWEYRPREDGYRRLFRQDRRTMKWYEGRIDEETGRFRRTSNANTILIGRREKYYDFSF